MAVQENKSEKICNILCFCTLPKKLHPNLTSLASKTMTEIIGLKYTIQHPKRQC